MSSENPIILDDNEAVMLSTESVHDTINTDDAAMDAFLEIMPHLTRPYATKMLQQTNGNLQQALTLVLEESQVQTTSVASCGNVDTLTITVDNTGVASLKTAPDECDEHNQKATPVSLDKKWHSLHQAARECGSVFVDSNFPPTSTSLDGRRHSVTNTATTEPSVWCVCGLMAKARTVQRNGRNYGRFYLACGQQDPTAQKCNFFQWDRDGSRGEPSRYSNLLWHSFQPPTCTLLGKGIGPHQVKQGAVGNCWFLSALAVVAEQPNLIQHIIPHTQLNDVGIYQVNLCLDGRWTPVIIDSHLPIVPQRNKKRPAAAFRGIVGDDFVPAFCDVPGGQLWPALLEKAYAKAHGSYAQLSGGFIAEALQDLTGAPTETLVFDTNTTNVEGQELLWAQLLSYKESNFLMGVATSQGGDGLVGGHAYSVLDVLEFQNVLIGEQQRVTDFFRSDNAPVRKKQRTTVRLLRIRNPWGKREWKGEWSANSEKWTTALRKKLGNQSFAKGDGTFFMAFQDVLRSFHHMDVAKCHQGWKHASMDGSFSHEAMDPLVSSHQVYRLNVTQRTWAFLSLVQPKKRANTKTQYWYNDLSMLMLRRPKGSDENWSCECCIVQGCSRCCTIEIFLDPSNEYICVPFSYGSIPRGALQGSPFRLTVYSSSTISVLADTRNAVPSHILLEQLHRKLLGTNHKIQYSVAENCTLLCIHGQDCLYFVAVNGASDRCLSLRLLMDVTKGIKPAYGCSGDTFDVSPRSQKILLVALSDGTDSAAASVSFSYVCDTIPTDPSKHSSSTTANATGEIPCKLGSSLEITMSGDLIATEVTSSAISNKGGDTIETHHWLSQLGSSV